MVRQNDESLTDVHGRICNNVTTTTVSSSGFSTTVESLDYFNIAFLKGNLTNNTILKQQPSVSNHTIIA